MGSLFTDEHLNCGQNLEEVYTSFLEAASCMDLEVLKRCQIYIYKAIWKSLRFVLRSIENDKSSWSEYQHGCDSNATYLWIELDQFMKVGAKLSSHDGY